MIAPELLAPLPPIRVAGLRLALKRHHGSQETVLAIPAPRCSISIWSDEMRGLQGRLSVLRAGWCPDCKNDRAGCECQDWDSPYRACRALDFEP